MLTISHPSLITKKQIPLTLPLTRKTLLYPSHLSFSAKSKDIFSKSKAVSSDESFEAHREELSNLLSELSLKLYRSGSKSEDIDPETISSQVKTTKGESENIQTISPPIEASIDDSENKLLNKLYKIQSLYTPNGSELHDFLDELIKALSFKQKLEEEEKQSKKTQNIFQKLKLSSKSGPTLKELLIKIERASIFTYGALLKDQKVLEDFWTPLTEEGEKALKEHSKIAYAPSTKASSVVELVGTSVFTNPKDISTTTKEGEGVVKRSLTSEEMSTIGSRFDEAVQSNNDGDYQSAMSSLKKAFEPFGEHAFYEDDIKGIRHKTHKIIGLLNAESSGGNAPDIAQAKNDILLLLTYSKTILENVFKKEKGFTPLLFKPSLLSPLKNTPIDLETSITTSFVQAISSFNDEANLDATKKHVRDALYKLKNLSNVQESKNAEGQPNTVEIQQNIQKQIEKFDDTNDYKSMNEALQESHQLIDELVNGPIRIQNKEIAQKRQSISQAYYAEQLEASKKEFSLPSPKMPPKKIQKRAATSTSVSTANTGSSKASSSGSKTGNPFSTEAFKKLVLTPFSNKEPKN